MKIAVCTTFPNSQFELCAREMLETFHRYWPEDIKIFIQLDEQPKESFEALNNAIIDVVGEERAFIAGLWDDDQKAFIERWKDHKPKSYMDNVVGFSHKVFALEKCADAIKDEYDYLIWLDADVITKKPVTYEWLKEVLPGENEVCSYLGREGFYSECGWVAYNLRCKGYKLLSCMKQAYLEDHFKDYASGGWTDCHVFDVARGWVLEGSGLSAKNLSSFYEHGKSQIDVWPLTKLAECLEHRKGNRKHKAKKTNVVDANELNIKTRNCLDHDKIKANVKENLGQIRTWASLCRPTEQDIVICAAGPSLAEHIEEIRELQNNGALVISVKHAINTLKAHDIKPWAVVLLDPRGHVEGFVKDPDPEPFYFVASMCDPSVVKTLNDHRCKVVGYHALVNAGEMELMISSDLPVSGGSATATRSIGLFADMFGFKNFHLFGYDLCYHQKPDMTETDSEGKPKYMEINIGTHTHKGKYLTRTFWTEGQFLAQSNEIKNLYKDRKDIKMTVYGNGMAGWLYRHHQLYERYKQDYNDNLNRKRSGTPTIDEYLNAATRGNDLARGV